jgi:hypothetical protein
MTSAGLEAAVVELPRGDSSNARAHTPDESTATQAAWLSAIPCALLVVAGVALLGPPLGRLLFGTDQPYAFLAGSRPAIHLEPTEHARFLLALGAPLLASLAIATAPRWQPRLSERVVTLAVATTQAALAAIVVACAIAQNRFVFRSIYLVGDQPDLTVHYFKPVTFVVAAIVAAAIVLGTRHEAIRAAAAAALRETRTRRLAASAAGLLLTAIWLLHAVHTDTTIATAPEDVRYHLGFTLDETFAVLDGLTPLADFTAQYGSLWPYLPALAMIVFGKTTLAFTLTMCVLGGLAALAIYGVLRRVTRSSLAALALYLPFLANGLFLIGAGTGAGERSTVGSYYGTFPLRYAGPFFVAWLTARRLDRGEDGWLGGWLLFTAAGLALLNNADFGAAAFGAALAALLWTLDAPAGAHRRRALLRLARLAVGGLATAFALVCALTLVRAGSLPQLGRLLDYARVYSLGGFSMMPVAGVFGMHLAIYLTYVAAICVATVRAVTRAANRVLTGMLAWSGVFGLGAAGYWIGRSHPVALKSMFAAWTLALALLTVVVVQRLVAQPARRPTIAAVAVLLGFGIATCSLAQVSSPWSQVERLGKAFAPTQEAPYDRPLVPPRSAATRRFVSSLAQGPSRFVVRRGAPVAILLTNGHRIADAYGVRNVSPYTGIESVVTVERVEAVVDALRRAGGNTVILPNPLDTSIFPVLQRRGFRLLTHHGLGTYDPRRTHTGAVMMPWLGSASMRWVPASVMKWVDARPLHPRALR